MASISHEKKTGRRAVQFVGRDGKRRTVRLGKVNKRQAETAKAYIEDLLACRTTGTAPKGTTAEWLAGVPDKILQRLERVGLVAQQERQECPTLAEWVRLYIKGRQDVKESTRLKYGQAEGRLLAFFDADKGLDDITPGDVDEFRVYLKSTAGLAEETVRSRMACGKLFFGAAVRKKILTSNPFDGQATASRGNPKREYFVTIEETEAVLDAIPDVRHRLLFALARYGGLRSPSEVQALKWADIHWDKKRFTVHATKTEHHPDAGIRIVPIFDELYPYLLDAFEAAEDRAVYCCPQHGKNAGQIYRKYIISAIAKAGLKPWPKLFQNLRSTRETELAEQFPSHVYCAWIGNSPRVAARHYLQVTEDHYAKAVQNPVQYDAALPRTAAHGEQADARKQGTCGPVHNETAPCEDREPLSMGDTGLEPVTLRV